MTVMRRLIPLLPLASLTLALGHPAAAAPKTPPAPRADACAARPAAGEPTPAEVEADFGCADALNLRLMLADPHDLQRGRPLSPAAGDPAFAAVRRWRQDQVKPLADAGAGGGAAPAAAQGGR
jgi:hypothetical protein